MIIQSQFSPAFGLSNPHAQTLFPYLQKEPFIKPIIQQTVELKDGDFIDLSWQGKPKNGSPIIILFHGLESTIDSHYIPRIMNSLQKQNWTCVLMHFRGCSGRPNRLAHSYHCGETGDARYVINLLKDSYPDSTLVATGFSLGGNMLLKLQAEYGSLSPLEAAVSICAPVQMDICARKMDQGISRFYQRILVNDLKSKILNKKHQFNYQQLINLTNKEIQNLKSFWQFDDLVTAPLNGFTDVHDYYSQSSARQYLKDIQKPTLMIQALDDPFMTPEIIPDVSELSKSIELEVCQHGGHIGFVSGSITKPCFWLQQRIPEYIKQFIN